MRVLHVDTQRENCTLATNEGFIHEQCVDACLLPGSIVRICMRATDGNATDDSDGADFRRIRPRRQTATALPGQRGNGSHHYLALSAFSPL